MTNAAIGLRWNMIIHLARCNDTIMTGSTVVGDTRMIESHTRKSVKVGSAMADRTILGGGQMVSRLTGTNDTIMTGGAVIGYASMVKHTVAESTWTMT